MEHVTSIAQLLCLSVEAEIQEAKSLSEVEQEIRRQMVEAGRQALETYLKKQQPKYPAKTSDCQYCGREAGYVRLRSGKLHTALGRVRYQRPYYLCEHCRQGTSPLDQALGLRPNQMSAELERLGGMTGVETSFEKGSHFFKSLTMVSLSNHSLDKAAQAYGREMEKVEQEWKQEAYDSDKLAQRRPTERPPLRLYGSMDAAKVHIRGDKGHPWRDLKLGAWFETRAQPPRQPSEDWDIRAENITYFTDICPAKEFTHLFWATGVQRNAHLARELVILGDGAEWIWNLVAENFPHAIQIVDWFHACEYLTPVAKAAFKDADRQTAWVQQVKTDLWHGRVKQVIAACEACLNPDLEDDPAQKAVSYFYNNQHRMDYATYRQNGYQIGSGTIESAAKQIGLRRLKVPGAIWNLDGARYVAKARAAYLSNQWSFLAQRRAHLSLAV